MYKGKTVAVVVPAYNEESQIGRVIDTLPDFVDRIIVVNDGSVDATSQVVRAYIDMNCTGTIIPKVAVDMDACAQDVYRYAEYLHAKERQEDIKYYAPHTIYNDNDSDKIVLIDEENSGKGAAIANGYRWCREHAIDCVATMDGDGQMNPRELERVISPIICEGIDFVKTNRLRHPMAESVIPRKRHWGNSILSILTKIASGYWRAGDSQTGYIAMSAHAIESFPLHTIYRSYGCPNDIMVKLNIANCTMREIVVEPVYNVGEQSKMKIYKVIPRLSFLLIRLFFHRLNKKYFQQDFHPLWIFYMLGFLLLIAVLAMLVYAIVLLCMPDRVVTESVFTSLLLGIVFMVQSFGFAMFMDIQDNDRLQK